MNLFHQHKWIVVSTDYTPPYDLPEMTGGSYTMSQIIKESVSGVTHVYQKCTKCGKIKHEQFLGKFSPTTTNDRE